MRVICAALAALFVSVVVAGCASTAANSPAQRVYAAQADYNVLLRAAVAYESLPRCAATVLQPCSNPDVVATIRKADNDAWAALRAAQQVARDPAASTSTWATASSAMGAALDAMRSILANRGLL